MKKLLIIFYMSVTQGQGIKSYEPLLSLLANSQFKRSVDKNVKFIVNNRDDGVDNGNFSELITKRISKSKILSKVYKYKKPAGTSERIKSKEIEEIRKSLRVKPSSTFSENYKKKNYLETTIQLSKSSFVYVTKYTRTSTKAKKDLIKNIKKSLTLTKPNTKAYVGDSITFSTPKYNLRRDKSRNWTQNNGNDKVRYNDRKYKNIDIKELKKSLGLINQEKNKSKSKNVDNQKMKIQTQHNGSDKVEFIVYNDKNTDIEELKKSLGLMTKVKNKSEEILQERKEQNSTSYYIQDAITTKKENYQLKNESGILASHKNITTEELSALKKSLGFFVFSSSNSTSLFSNTTSTASIQSSKLEITESLKNKSHNRNSTTDDDNDAYEKKLSKILLERRFESKPRKLINMDSNKKQIDIILKSWELGSQNYTQALSSYNDSQLKEILKQSPGLRKLKEFREAKNIEDIKNNLGYFGKKNTQNINNDTIEIQVVTQNTSLTPKFNNETQLFKNTTDEKELEEIKKSLTLFGREINQGDSNNNHIQQKLEPDDQHKTGNNYINTKTTGTTKFIYEYQPFINTMDEKEIEKIKKSLTLSEQIIDPDDQRINGINYIITKNNLSELEEYKTTDLSLKSDICENDTVSEEKGMKEQKKNFEQNLNVKNYNDSISVYDFYEVGKPVPFPQYRITTESYESVLESSKTSKDDPNFQVGFEITNKKDQDNVQQALYPKTASNTNQKSNVVSIKYYKPIQILNNPVYISKDKIKGYSEQVNQTMHTLKRYKAIDINDELITQQEQSTSETTIILHVTKNNNQGNSRKSMIKEPRIFTEQLNQNIDLLKKYKAIDINEELINQPEQSKSKSKITLHGNKLTTKPDRNKNETVNKSIRNTFANVPNSFISEFSNLIDGYVKDKLSKTEADEKFVSLIQKIDIFKKKNQNKSFELVDNDPKEKNKKRSSTSFNLQNNRIKLITNFNEKEDRALMNLLSSRNANRDSEINDHEKEDENNNHFNLLNDAMKSLRNLIENEERALMSYDWLSSTISIHVGIHRIKKLCNVAGVSEDEKKLMRFINKVFETSVDLLPDETYEQRLDQVCIFFQDILKHLRPLHLAMDHISSKKLANNEQMFKALKIVFLPKLTEKTLAMLILHVATNRILHEIDSKFENAYLSRKLRAVLADKSHENENTINETKRKNVSKYRNDNRKISNKSSTKNETKDEECESIEVEKEYADLIEDFMLIYTILFDLSKEKSK